MDDLKNKIVNATGAWEEVYKKAVDAFSKSPGMVVVDDEDDDEMADFDAIMAEPASAEPVDD